MERRSVSENRILTSVVSRVSESRHLLLWTIVIGLVIRIIMMSVSMGYDADYWAVVIRNIDAGDGLYDAEGYYYTPVWGYILGLVAAFQDAILCIGESAVRVIEALPVEGIPDHPYLSATVTSLAFNYSVKTPLVVFDLILALLVRYLVKDFCGDSRKADLSFALVFLCPVLIGSTCVIGMPDTIAATFTVLTIILLRKDMYLLAGAAFSMAVLTKFFPAFLLFLLVAYVIMRNRERAHHGLPQMVLAAAGAVIVAGVVFLPQLISGNISQCFQFLTDRTGTGGGEDLLDFVIGQTRVLAYLVVLLASVYLAYRLYKKGEGGLENRFLKYAFMIVTLCLVYPPTTQYMVLLVPFLAMWIGIEDRRYMLSWKVMAVGSMIYMFSSNALMFLSLAEWTNIISVDTLISIFLTLDWGLVSIMNVMFVVGGIMQCASIILVLYIMFEYRIKAHFNRGGVNGISG